MRRAVILATLTFLLLAVAGITVARERTPGPVSNHQTESTVQGNTTTREYTEPTDEGSTERSEPAARSVAQNSTVPEADEPEVAKEVVAEGKGEDAGKPEGVGKLAGKGKSPSAGKPQDVGKPEGVGGRPEGTGEPPGQGKAADVGKAKGLGGGKPEGKTKGGEREDNGGGGQQKVTLCHRGKNTIKNTITVGAPATEAHHRRHGDTEGACAQ